MDRRARARLSAAPLRWRLARWRRVGLLPGLRRAVAVLARVARGWALTGWLRLRPVRAAPADVRAALGGATALDALRGPVLAALPSVAAFGESLDGLDAAARARLLEVADRVLGHELDLLGSGPVALGPEIDWHRDFKTGRRWPLRHHSIVPIAYPDASDVKVPWELSRCQHLPVLAAAHRLTGRDEYLDEIGAQLERWIRANPVGLGTNWAVAMEVAIRAANWVAALALCAEAAASRPWLDRVVESLLLHGRFVRGHLEGGEVRGNHYLSDVAGLLVVAALFSGGAEGRAWAEWGAAQLAAEMEHQVLPDGAAHEASLGYHRLVCELFACGAHAADALAPGTLPAAFRERLDRMLQLAADAARPDGLTPVIGDADDGRFLPLADYGRADPRRHGHLFAQAGRRAAPAARARAAYPDGGFWFLRGDGLYLAIRCGPTGMRGRGPHAHNDQLAFELACGEQPLVTDPGTGAYTADPALRNLLRSTRSHATLAVDGAEQNELHEDDLFLLADGTRAEALEWAPDGRPAVWAGRHRGYERLREPAIHHRRLELDTAAGTLVVTDTVESAGRHALEWTFPLAPCEAAVVDGAVEARFPGGARLTIGAPGVALAVEEGRCSPRYGVVLPAPFVRARRTAEPGRDVTAFTLRVVR